VYEGAIAALRLTVASPQLIRSWSYGEVSRPETINYLTQKPEPGGLFCERIFGPTRDWTCFCGKYKRKRTPGFRCEECGVEITESTVRRERMGHIELCVPVAHPWFARGHPSIIATLLDISPRQLGAVLSYSASLVTQIDEEQRRLALSEARAAKSDTVAWIGALTVGTVLDEQQDQMLSLRYSTIFHTERGAAAIRAVLSKLDLDALAHSLRQSLRAGTPQKKVLKRLRLVEAFRASGVNPAWMILSVLPVLPPELRPLVPLDGGRYAASDLNALYERIIHRNARIKRFLALGAPDIILNNEKRLLQEACDALFDNRHIARPRLSSTGQPLKSLTDIISGKQGRFRRNLLGKRVDYSGRSVIVGDPQLKLHQCGLPTKICLELFKPFMMRKLLERNLVPTARAAKRLVERTRRPDPVVWDLLEEVMEEKIVLLNRAPTLHRLSIQAFEAVRVEGSAIRLHPLVCSAFNADFDGDQMAVHLPLSDEAQEEARRLLLSTRNLRSPAAGEPAISISQEMVLGLFYLTQERPSHKSAGRCFADAAEALLALAHNVIDLHTRIVVRLPDACVYEAPGKRVARPSNRRIETTVGRLLFNEALPPRLRFRNYAMSKEHLKRLLAECLQICGEEETARLADDLKRLGFSYATRSGISFAISDIEVPPEKHTKLRQAEDEARAIEEQETLGMITEEERNRALIALWSKATEEISQSLEAHLDQWGSLATIIKSGATKAKFQQIRQLGGIRGLLANPSGEIIPVPVKGNYLEGLKVWEVFIAASGARKGFMDRSLNTARSGYLTRKLVEAGMEVWITMEDCETHDAICITNEESRALGLSDMKSRLIGRVLSEDLEGLTRGTLLSEELVDHLLERGVSAVRVRSPLGCHAAYGLCQQCYGLDLASGELVRKGTAVGIIAAQSVGEPGTQLTMRTFHSGGIANAQGDITAGLPRVEELFEARPPRTPALLAEISGTVHLSPREAGGVLIRVRECELQADSQVGGGKAAFPFEERSYGCPAGRELQVKDGEQILAGTPLTAGTVHPQDLLRVCGREVTSRYLVNEVQRVYRQTGVYLNDKHVECIVRQMLKFMQIREPGDTALLPDTIVDRFTLLQTNAAILAEGGCPATAQPVLLGLTKAILATDSWVAAASFQETSRVLTYAAIRGQRDDLRGLKEKLILGKLIPSRL